MRKYDIVLFRDQKEDFLERLQELGMVDITTTGWEPDEQQRELISSIEKNRAAVDRLKTYAAKDECQGGVPYESGQEAFKAFIEASTKADDLTARIDQAEKEAEEIRLWGDFDPKALNELADAGIIIRYFRVSIKEYETQIEQWQGEYDVVAISHHGGMTNFVVVASAGQDVEINAQEVRPLEYTYAEKEREIEELTKARSALDKELARAVASRKLIEEHLIRQKEELHVSQVRSMSREEADGTLIIMEGWAPENLAGNVTQMLNEYPNLYYIKAKPTPEDDTPTLLKNNKFNSMFEIVGNFYSMPKYGTMDLTPYFGPFYALFFGLCLADAGYGLIYFVAGIVMRAKLAAQWRNMANLVIMLGFSTMVCGFLLDSFFGLKITNWAPLSGIEDYLLAGNMFVVALGLGVVQILFAMILKIVLITKRFGFKYSLATLGWLLALYFTLIWGVPIYLGMQPIISTTVYLPILIVGSFLMLFMNSPGKNPFLNFGTGLWDLYNNLTGFISDFLSYIRLFAIGLSGGILAAVFNDLAVGLSGNVPVLKQIFMIIILLIGHGITIFMSTISAFVHPMRLTFVEFYKNAGFEDTLRVYEPLKRETKE